MGRGGRRPNSGRKPKSPEHHLLTGSWRVGRHGPRPSANVVPMPESSPDWRPTLDDRAGLGPRALGWLDTTLGLYAVDDLEGRRLLAALRTLTRIEALEHAIATAVANSSGEPNPLLAALAREQRVFLSQWATLELGRA
jgi:hypothetical protein